MIAAENALRFPDWKTESIFIQRATSPSQMGVPWRKSGKSIRNMRESRLVRLAATSVSFEPQCSWFVRCDNDEHLRWSTCSQQVAHEEICHEMAARVENMASHGDGMSNRIRGSASLGCSILDIYLSN